ncbi:MAG: alpha-ketoglutarate-dependent dioxygenase AlkB [Microthrixaceae bacterium]
MASCGVLQRSLFGSCESGLQPASFERIEAGPGTWLDVGRNVLAGADDLLYVLAESTDWRIGRRMMWDREVDDPRLMRWYRRGEGDPHPLLGDVRALAEARYGRELGGLGLNYYRDGSDSVAFHADRELRELTDSIVVILVLGERRPFLVRPVGGGASIDLAPASGDVVVMGGRCQADFEHSVPKTARRIGPRISASWRWSAGPTATVAREGGYFESRRWRTLSE